MGFLVRASKPLGNLYHFISPDNLSLALNRNAMKPLSGSQPMEMKEKYRHYKNDRGHDIFYGVSTTRNPTWKPEGGKPWADIRITFDGTKISQKYKVKSYNDFWNMNDYAAKKRLPNDEFYSQAEEKIITDKHGLKDFLKYVTSIEVLETARDAFEKNGLDKKLQNVPVSFVTEFSRK